MQGHTHHIVSHIHNIAGILSRTRRIHQTVEFVITIGMGECTTQLGWIHTLVGLRTDRVLHAKDIVNGIITICIRHHLAALALQFHPLQAVTHLVVAVGGLHAVAEFRIYGMSFLVIA